MIHTGIRISEICESGLSNLTVNMSDRTLGKFLVEIPLALGGSEIG